MRMRGLSWNRTKCVDCKAEEESELGIVSFSVRDGSTAVCMHTSLLGLSHTQILIFQWSGLKSVNKKSVTFPELTIQISKPTKRDVFQLDLLQH